MYEGFVAIKA